MSAEHVHAPITEIEKHGVEFIPSAERDATPFDLFRMAFGGANTFSTAVLGALPIMLGLSFQQGAIAILIGVVIGALLLTPMSLFGQITGTNNAVSSGAHFGVHGRIVGSFLSLLTAIAFFSLSVWSSGDALVAGGRRLIGAPESKIALALVYGLFAVIVLVICIYGFRFMLLVNRIAVSSATLLFALGIFAFAGVFDPNYAGHFALDALGHRPAGLLPAMVSAILLAMSNPLSFGAFLGDWTRYIPTESSKPRVMAAAFLSQIATLVPFGFGLCTATVVAAKAPEFIHNYDYVGGLMAVSPGWYFLPLCLIALIGGLSTGTTSLYGTGLDMSSVFTRLSRVAATILIGVLSIAFIFIGRFMANLVGSVSTFAVLIVTCTRPWMVIMTIGIFTRRGFYLADDLQVFTRRQEGGAYWFSHGWNWRAMGAWFPSAALGLCFVNVPDQFVGPLGRLAAGIDLSIPVTMGAAAFFYLAALNLFPEPATVFGPLGPRWVRAGEQGHEDIRVGKPKPATTP